MPTCPKCGYENAADALFCNLCQESFRRPKAEAPAQKPELVRREPRPPTGPTVSVLLIDPLAAAPAAVAEVLARFNGVPAFDMMGAAKAARGIVAERLADEKARALAEAFGAAGLPARAVPDAELVAPPLPVTARRLDIDAAGFRSEAGAGARWSELRAIIAAGVRPQAAGGQAKSEGGCVEGQFLQDALQAIAENDFISGNPILKGLASAAVELRGEALKPLPRAQEPEPSYCIGLLAAGGLHLWIDAQRFDFSCLKELKQMNALMNFRSLVGEIARLAPAAARGLGVRVILEGRPMHELVCASPRELEREYRWLLALPARRD